MEKINAGCGMTPTLGWRNVDNSMSLRMSRIPLLADVLGAMGILNGEQRSYIAFCRKSDIVYADASRRLPFATGSADAIYSSHMLEHLTRAQAKGFLSEARRVLAVGGILRVAVPDLALLVERYREDGDADTFVADSLLASEPPQNLMGRLRVLIAGPRHHRWMYDGPSLIKLMTDNGFEDAVIVPAGTTTIPEPGELDLSERAGETVYVEARAVA